MAQSNKRSLEPEETSLDEDFSSPQKRRPATVLSPRSNSGDKENAADHPNAGAVAAAVTSSPQPANVGRNNDAAAETIQSPLRQINPVGKPAEAGILKQIYVENFMCHRKLRVTFCRNVNFIHGQNGSGKSAILAAIQICLGANARRTHRARNLKELVRKETASGSGPGQAKIQVTLYNQGDDGYKPEIYGDSITVERTIALRGGYNGYKLLDCNGVEKSRSKKDLDEMLDMLNIQVENPVSILDQEEAKKFLMGKSQDKYNFFMKATELERIDRTYASTVDNVQELGESQEKIRGSLEQSLEHVEMLKKKWEQHQALDKLKDKEMELNVKYAWSLYNCADEDYQRVMEKMDKFEKKVAAKEEELTQAEEAAAAPEDEQQVKQQRMDELVIEAQEQATLKRKADKDLKEAVAPYKTMERQLKNLKRQQITEEKKFSAAKKRLQEARDELVAQAGTAEQEQAQRTAKLKEAEEEHAAAREKVNELKQTVSDTLRAYDELVPHVQDAKGKVETISRQVNGIKSTISELKSSANDSLAVLGPRVRKVKQMVEKAKRDGKFRGKVVGPIGAYLKVVPGKEAFAGIAELAIGSGSLDRFIVTNDEDRSTLMSIRKKAGCTRDCNVFQLVDKPRFNILNPTVEGIDTVVSVLNITDDLVFNCLVDNASIDRQALATNKETSERKLLVKEGSFYKARGIINKVLYLPNGDNWTVRNGVLVNYSNDSSRMRHTIGVDKSAAIASSEQELRQLQTELKEMRSEEARLEGEHTQRQRQWNQANKALKRNDMHIANLASKIDDIRGDVESAANVNIDTTEYEEDVNQAEQATEGIKEQYSQLRSKMEEAKPAIDDLRKHLEEITMRNEKVLHDMQAAELDMNKFLETQSQHQDIVAKKRKKVEQYREVIAKHQANVDKYSSERESLLFKARKLEYDLGIHKQQQKQDEHGILDVSEQADPTAEDLQGIEPRVMAKDTKYYETRIKSTKQKIERERERRDVSNEDRAVTYEKYLRAKNDLDAKTKQVDDIEKKMQILVQDLRNRKRLWKQFRQHLTKKTSIKFDEMLALNNYSGELKFSHDDYTLDLAVAKDGANEKGKAKDVKGLSGGERSYTTISLLLALGENLETPFRVLDEFDVFLDAEVRKLTIKSLIHVAKQMQHRQFIFITPQDVSSLKADPQLKIWKLSPPARHDALVGGPSQQTLDFSQT